MKRAVLLASLGLLTPFAAELVSAQAANAIEEHPQPDEIETARNAIALFDSRRLDANQEYPAEILRHLDVLDRATDDPDADSAIDTLRLQALTFLEQDDQIRTVVDRVLARRPTEPDSYIVAWDATLSIPDPERLVLVVEQASRHLRGVGWADLRETIGAEVPAILLGHFAQNDNDAMRFRLAEALFRIGWPGEGDLERSNGIRLTLLDHELERHNARAAADLAAGLTDPVLVLPLIVLRRYDELFDSGPDRLARLRSAIVDYDRLTLEGLGADPTIGAAYDRARFLRTLGRDGEAFALLEPFTRDVPATVAADYRGMWVINEAAYALLGLDRKDEAVALMERLIALPVAGNSDLIGPYINHAAVLRRAGRHADALAHAMRLDREFSQYASDYGKGLIARSIVCSLVALNRADEARPMLERLRAGSDSSLVALIEAYLCLGDTEAAEAVAVRKLESERPDSMILAFQDYAETDDAAPDPLDAQVRSLRDRPAVRAALERVGRVLQLPLARINS